MRKLLTFACVATLASCSNCEPEVAKKDMVIESLNSRIIQLESELKVANERFVEEFDRNSKLRNTDKGIDYNCPNNNSARTGTTNQYTPDPLLDAYYSIIEDNHVPHLSSTPGSLPQGKMNENYNTTDFSQIYVDGEVFKNDK